ncbi:hypothetical protein PHLGIDRAFT_127234 [Phlebiopsis gigantea 11061_1 CR5-6]|uniref:Transmembrane protein n=1 Tax=Phlebiopsis gigantea (strain 11061_1 CR5-6) TaxID=745531 RepID=A0A0C3S003_PHLG1|nr:hypothetical protein PHLGIDRAFT_127234 [Phlebiopsis gigantea 11061_1 CR5-6]
MAGVRAYAKNVKPKPTPPPATAHLPEPEEHRRSWFWTANRLSNFVVIPMAVLYCVFYADYGDGEHVFSPMRRWLHRQRDAFFSLSPEERQLVRENKESSPDQTPQSSR